MEITEIRIKLMESSEDRLRAFCSITIDESFVVRDLKIIDGTNGPFVAMPSRKLSGHCHRCNHKNHLRASYCNNCGVKLNFDSEGSYDSPQKLYADVAHPINSECREIIQNAVIKEFDAELARASEPGYRSRYDDEFDFEASDAEIVAKSMDAAQAQKGEPVGKEQLAESESSTEQPSVTSEPKPAKEARSVPRPKFIDQDKRKRASAKPAEDDDFGAGIF